MFIIKKGKEYVEENDRNTAKKTTAEAEIGLVRAVLALSETAGGSDWKERTGAAAGADGVTGLAILTLLLCGFAIGCSGTING